MFSVVLPVPCLIMGSSSSLADGEVCRWYRRVLSVLCPARAVFSVCLENAERLRHPLKPRLIPGNSLFPLLQRLQTNRHCSLNGYVRLLKQHQLENKIVGNQRQIFVTLVSILCSAKFQPLVSLWHTEGTNHFCHLVVSCIAAFMFFFCVCFILFLEQLCRGGGLWKQQTTTKPSWQRHRSCSAEQPGEEDGGAGEGTSSGHMNLHLKHWSVCWRF